MGGDAFVLEPSLALDLSDCNCCASDFGFFLMKKRPMKERLYKFAPRRRTKLGQEISHVERALCDFA